MRIKTGNKVEAWITDDATIMGAWRAGEVFWGNGHSYVMKWFDGGPDSARIVRKFVRPMPDPDVKLPEDLAAGDIVELFDSNLWKWVEVVRVGDRQFDVKFVGSTRVFTADRSLLRPRMLYGEKGWTLLHKNGQIPIESAVPSRPIPGKSIKSKAIGNGTGNGVAAHAVKLGKTKRSDYTVVGTDIVRDVKRFQGNRDTNRLFAQREEPAARYNDNTEVMDVHPSHYLEKRQETGNNDDCFLARRTDSDKDDDASSKSDTSSSSTGDSSSSSSSSGSNSNGGDITVSRGHPAVSTTVEHCQENQEAEIQLLPSCKEEEQDSNDKTESCASARMQQHRADDVQVVMKQEEQHDRRVHALELEAYVSVMKAFHATGSLTWTKEELLSDLRVHLHISSDEHLKVIWRLNGKKKPAGGPRNGHC